MSTLHWAALVVHVVTAILGLGLTTATALAAGFARKNTNAGALLAPLFSRYLVMISASLALVLLSGIALEIAANGAWHTAWFFRLGFLLVIVVGALSGRSRGAVKAIATSNADASKSFARIETFAWAMCGAVALAAFLMVLKPG